MRKIAACVVSDPRDGKATLEWRELLGIRKKTINMHDHDPEFKDELEEVEIPDYGEVLVSTVRTHAEFIREVSDKKVGITAYVLQHLPAPEGQISPAYPLEVREK